MQQRMDGLRVLIVEDDAIYAAAVKCLLERDCHTVVGIAAQAGEAYAMARENQPDLALIDLHLDDGETGADIGRGLALELFPLM